MSITTTKRTTNIIIFFSLIVSFCTVSLLATTTVFMVTDKIYTGVTVGTIRVGGLSAQEAQEKIYSSFESSIEQPPITLEYKENEWKISAEDIELRINAADLANQAYSIGRKGSFFQQVAERYIAIHYGHTIPLIPSYNDEKLRNALAITANAVDIEPRNAELFLSGSKVRIMPDVKGSKVDIDNLTETVIANLNISVPFILDLPVNELAPSTTAQDFKDIDGVIAIYTTYFDSGNQNRAQNIRLAANSIHGVLIRAGEVFSFNNRVGPRLAEFGYKEAPVFVEGKIVPDLGGGVCQVSSTLYNAVLLADMRIEERTPHFRPPGYVPLGQDATVADNLLDFKFKNSLPYNAYIYSEISGDQITIYILGKSTTNRGEIEIVSADKEILEPNTIIKQDPELDFGKEIIESSGQKGFTISTYRVKRINGNEISRDFLFTDEFKPDDKIIRVGTKNKSSKGTK